MGDRVLKEVAAILTGDGRRTDLAFRPRSQDIAARYGGDEFALVLPDTPKRGAAVKAERLRQAIERHDFRIGDSAPQPTASVGIAAYPFDADVRDVLVAAADTALYAAKVGGRNKVVTFTSRLWTADRRSSKEGAEEEARVMLALAETMEGGLFEFAFQPIVEASSTTVYGYEALCRPTHEAFAGPLDLITAAHRAGRVQDLGLALRQRAVEQLAALPESQSLFINIDPLEFNEQLITWADTLVHPERVIFEVTESAAISDNDRYRKWLVQLQERGFRIALDDLGDGYSGLNSLVALEPDFVKLEMELVRGVDTSPRSARLVRHLIEYCEEEGVAVIGEGIENAEERDASAGLGCRLLQGYYFGRPGPPFVGVEIDAK